MNKPAGIMSANLTTVRREIKRIEDGEGDNIFM